MTYGPNESAPDLPVGPTSVYVEQFHRNSDVDSSVFAQHHTLGMKSGQATDGRHNHDGKNSVKLLEGYTINGASSVADIITCLVALGAEYVP